MAFAGSELSLLAGAKERAICDFGSVVRTVLMALRVCGKVGKQYSEEKSNRTREMYSVIRKYCEQAALNGVWAHITLTQRSHTPTEAVFPATVWKKFDCIVAFLRRFNAGAL